MSGPDNQPDDTLLEDFLAGKSDLSRAYAKVDAPSAPASLDGAVLDLARQAPVLRVSRWKRLRTPVALAATFVMGLSVMLNIQRDPAAYEITSAPAAMTERVVMADVPAAPQPAPMPLEKPEQRKSLAATSAPKEEAMPPVAQEMMETSAMADAGAPPPAAAVAPAMDSMRRVEEAERNYTSAMTARKMAAPQSAAAQIAAEAMVDSESAEHWRVRIRALRDTGKDEEARKLWAEYRLIYPAEVIPVDLQRYEPINPAEKSFSGDPTPSQ